MGVLNISATCTYIILCHTTIQLHAQFCTGTEQCQKEQASRSHLQLDVSDSYKGQGIYDIYIYTTMSEYSESALCHVLVYSGSTSFSPKARKKSLRDGGGSLLTCGSNNRCSSNRIFHRNSCKVGSAVGRWWVWCACAYWKTSKQLCTKTEVCL